MIVGRPGYTVGFSSTDVRKVLQTLRKLDHLAFKFKFGPLDETQKGADSVCPLGVLFLVASEFCRRVHFFHASDS